MSEFEKHLNEHKQAVKNFRQITIENQDLLKMKNLLVGLVKNSEEKNEEEIKKKLLEINKKMETINRKWVSQTVYSTYYNKCFSTLDNYVDSKFKVYNLFIESMKEDMLNSSSAIGKIGHKIQTYLSEIKKVYDQKKKGWLKKEYENEDDPRYAWCNKIGVTPDLVAKSKGDCCENPKYQTTCSKNLKNYYYKVDNYQFKVEDISGALLAMKDLLNGKKNFESVVKKLNNLEYICGEMAKRNGNIFNLTSEIYEILNLKQQITKAEKLLETYVENGPWYERMANNLVKTLSIEDTKKATYRALSKLGAKEFLNDLEKCVSNMCEIVQYIKENKQFDKNESALKNALKNVTDFFSQNKTQSYKRMFEQWPEKVTENV